MEPLPPLGFRATSVEAPIHTGSTFASMVEMAFSGVRPGKTKRGNLVYQRTAYACRPRRSRSLFLDALRTEHDHEHAKWLNLVRARASIPDVVLDCVVTWRTCFSCPASAVMETGAFSFATFWRPLARGNRYWSLGASSLRPHVPLGPKSARSGSPLKLR